MVHQISTRRQIERRQSGAADLSVVCMRAMSFLVERQSADGAWRDFDLAPGLSDAWVTVYIASRVLPFVEDHSSPDFARVIECAARFLRAARHQQGGWSYNLRCQPDADSTAQTLLFLREVRHTAELRDYAALARFQLADGAFATYKTQSPEHGWGRGCPDVTVVALRALAGVLPRNHIILRRGYESVCRYLDRPEPWASYWWLSHLYLARETIVLKQAQPQTLPFLPTLPHIGKWPNCFERALALEIALLTNAPPQQLSRLAHHLAQLQLSDGSWESAPILRVTDPRSCCYDDELCRNSPVVRDHLRLFTTATVLGALSRLDRLRRIA